MFRKIKSILMKIGNYEVHRAQAYRSFLGVCIVSSVLFSLSSSVPVCSLVLSVSCDSARLTLSTPPNEELNTFLQPDLQRQLSVQPIWFLWQPQLAALHPVLHLHPFLILPPCDVDFSDVVASLELTDNVRCNCEMIFRFRILAFFFLYPKMQSNLR